MVFPLIKIVSQHLSKTTKAMQNFRIAGLHKGGVLTHIPDVQWRGQLRPFGGFIPFLRNFTPITIE